MAMMQMVGEGRKGRRGKMLCVLMSVCRVQRVWNNIELVAAYQLKLFLRQCHLGWRRTLAVGTPTTERRSDRRWTVGSIRLLQARRHRLRACRWFASQVGSVQCPKLAKPVQSLLLMPDSGASRPWIVQAAAVLTMHPASAQLLRPHGGLCVQKYGLDRHRPDFHPWSIAPLLSEGLRSDWLH